jgi:hypothetical protein
MRYTNYEKRIAEVNLCDGKDFADAMSSFLNGLGSDKQKKFIETMGRDHFCLKQSFTRLCVEWLRHLSRYRKDQYSVQNEASVLLAKEIFEKIEPDKFIMPFI